MGGLADEASRAHARNEGATVRMRFGRWLKALPRRVRTYGPDVMGWGGGIGLALWEMRNATLGFQQMWRPGLWVAALGAIGAYLAFIFCVRVMMEFFRGKNIVAGAMFMVLSLGALAVVLFGVWSQLAADTIRRGNHSIEMADDRKAIIKNIRTYEGQLRALPETIDVELAADEESLTTLMNIGRQWDLPKLDSAAGGDCDKQLKPYPRSLCNQASELRASIKEAQGYVEKRKAIQVLLTAEQGKLVDEVDSAGVEHLEEMGQLLGDKELWSLIGTIATLVASLILSVLDAAVLDLMMERGQRRKETQA